MERIIGKLTPNLVWLYAIGALALGIAAAFATQGLGAKVTAAVYAGIVAIAGFASTFTTSARVRTAVLAFLLAAVAAAALYFVVVSSVIAGATTAMADTVSLGQAGAESAEAGSVMGTFFGVVAAVVAFAETAFFGIGGAVVGSRARAELAAQTGHAAALG
jgi:hypothetical protein